MGRTATIEVVGHLVPAVPSAEPRQLEIAAFDARRGRLVSVAVHATLVVRDERVRMEHLGQSEGCPGNPASDAWYLAVAAEILGPSNEGVLGQMTSVSSGAIPPLPVFDGAIDFCGDPPCVWPTVVCTCGSGFTFNCPDPEPVHCPTHVVNDAPDLARYVQLGPDGTVTFRLLADVSHGASAPCFELVSTFRAEVGCDLRISYTYSPNPPAPVGAAFCFGDGSLATACPCASPDTVPSPSGARDAGCANSFDPDGARLTAVGAVFPDTLAMSAWIGPNYAGFAFLVKSDGSSAAGTASGDGVSCLTGALVRFGGHQAGTFGAAIGSWTYPNPGQPMAVSSVTSQTPGVSAFYQLAYRNVAVGFCNPSSMNWSNAVRIDW